MNNAREVVDFKNQFSRNIKQNSSTVCEVLVFFDTCFDILDIVAFTTSISIDILLNSMSKKDGASVFHKISKATCGHLNWSSVTIVAWVALTACRHNCLGRDADEAASWRYVSKLQKFERGHFGRFHEFPAQQIIGHDDSSGKAIPSAAAIP